MRDIKNLIKVCSDAMSEKLLENSHKENWDNITFENLIRLADNEIIEFKQSFFIFKNNLREKKYSLNEMRREAADVVNFFAMIIEKCEKEKNEL